MGDSNNEPQESTIEDLQRQLAEPKADLHEDAITDVLNRSEMAFRSLI
jgi:hypothetical protein